MFFALYHLLLSGNLYGSEIRHGIFVMLNFGPGIFWGFDLPPLGHPCHLKSGVPPLGVCHWFSLRAFKALSFLLRLDKDCTFVFLKFLDLSFLSVNVIIPFKFGTTANLTSVSVTSKLQSTLNESRGIYFHPLALFSALRASLGKLRFPNALPFGRRSFPPSNGYFTRFVTRSYDGLIGQVHVRFSVLIK